MCWRPPISKRPYTLFPYTTLFRSNSQQDAKQVTWLAPARLFSRSSTRNNRNAFASAGGALQFDMLPVQAPTSAVTLSMGGADFDIAPAIAKWMPREKHTVKVPLSCFVERGADLGGVDVPFSVEAAAPFAASFTSIKIVAGAGEDADEIGRAPV